MGRDGTGEAERGKQGSTNIEDRLTTLVLTNIQN